MRKNQLATLFLLSVLALSFWGSSVVSIGNPPPLLTTSSPPSSQKIGSGASEEEQIDSFDVHPESLRWDTTLDDSLEDRVQDSLFEVLTVNNETSGSDGYEMNRGTEKTDGKFEWRMKTDGSGNQSEYFRDVIGDECDFTEDQEGLAWNYGSESHDEGKQKVVSGSSQTYLYSAFTTDFFLPTIHFVKTVIRYKITSDVNYIAYRYNNRIIGFQLAVINSIDESEVGIWHETTMPNMNDWDGRSINGLGLYVSKNAATDTPTLYIDFIKIYYELDYATYTEGGIEDTWDFEDSDDYFYDEESNISDFNDGTVEGWIDGDSNTDLTVSDGWLEVSPDASAGSSLFNYTGLSIDASVYKYFTAEIKATTHEIDYIRVYDSDSNIAKVWNTNIPQGDIVLLNGELTTGWTGTESELNIFIRWTYSDAGHLAEVNFTFLYDVELGDIEGWSGVVYEYTNPEGYIVMKPTVSTTDYLNSPVSEFSCDLFSTLKLRFKTIGSLNSVQFRSQYENLILLDVGGESNTGWLEYEVDLSDIEGWSGNHNNLFYIRLNGATEGTYFLLDYWILTGSFNPSDIVIGLMDNDGFPLLNISTHFESNNTARFEFELMDSSGALSYYWYSDYYSDVAGQFFMGKVTFDVLRSKLDVSITAENNSRIDKITFPNEFLVDSGLMPALFINELGPNIFVSTYTVSHSWSHLFLDWIKADFKSRGWINTDIPSDSDMTSNSPLAYGFDGNVLETSRWQLNVPYLDSVSGIMRANYTPMSGMGDLESIQMTFRIYSVGNSDGAKSEVFELMLNIIHGVNPTDYVQTAIYIEVGGSDVVSITGGHDEFISPKVSFSISISEDRSKAVIKNRAWIDSSEETSYEDSTFDLSINAKSQEFILETEFLGIQLAGTESGYGYFEDFGFTDKDIFQDIVQAVVEPIGNFIGQIFTAAFKFLADIFKGVGNVIGDVINVGIGVVTIAIDGISSVLSGIATAIDNIATSIGTVITELQGLAGDVATAIWSGIGNALDFITEAIANIATDITNAIADVITDLSAVIADIAGDVIDTLISSVGSLIDDAITWLISVAVDLADLVFDIIELLLGLLVDLIDEFFTLIFAIWDSVPLLVGISDVVDLVFTSFMDILTAVPDLFADVMAWVMFFGSFVLIIWWFWAFFLSFAESNFNPFEGMGNFIEKCFFNLLPISLLGFEIYVPMGLFFIPLTFFLILAESAFYIW